MNTLMVLGDRCGFPPDIRIEKEARSLIKAGHRVSLLCLKAEGKDAPSEVVDGVHVLRVKQPPLVFGRMETLARRAGIGSSLSPYWADMIAKAALVVLANVLHIHDLPMFDNGLVAARELDIPIIADLHELYPEMLKAYFPFWKGRAIYHAGRWHQKELRCFREATEVITISEPAADYQERKHGRRPVVVGNQVDLEYFDSLPIDEEIVHSWDGDFVVMYLGSYGAHRGLDVLVKAFTELVRKVPEARLVLVGEHPQSLKWSVPTEVNKRIVITGWVDDALFPSYMQAASVLVHPIRSLGHSPQIEFCCPHKVFDYMAAGKPIVATVTVSLKDYIGLPFSSLPEQFRYMGFGDEHAGQAGFLFTSGCWKCLADDLLRLHRDRGARSEFGQNGRRAVETRFNWEIESQKLLQVYDRIGERTGGSR